jgi:hypothetical protein
MHRRGSNLQQLLASSEQHSYRNGNINRAHGQRILGAFAGTTFLIRAAVNAGLDLP